MVQQAEQTVYNRSASSWYNTRGNFASHSTAGRSFSQRVSETMKFIETELKGAYIVEPERHEDERGFFARTFCQEEFVAHGLNPKVMQATGPCAMPLPGDFRPPSVVFVRRLNMLRGTTPSGRSRTSHLKSSRAKSSGSSVATARARALYGTIY